MHPISFLLNISHFYFIWVIFLRFPVEEPSKSRQNKFTVWHQHIKCSLFKIHWSKKLVLFINGYSYFKFRFYGDVQRWKLIFAEDISYKRVLFVNNKTSATCKTCCRTIIQHELLIVNSKLFVVNKLIKSK